MASCAHADTLDQSDQSILPQTVQSDSPTIQSPSEMPEPKQTSLTTTTSSDLPNLLNLPLHEWIAALTHPIVGLYPMGLNAKLIDDLAKQSKVTQFPSADRLRFHSIWKSIPHLAVHLSDAARKGRIRRIKLGTYVGVFENDLSNEIDRTSQVKTEENESTQIAQGETANQSRKSNKRKSSSPKRHPSASETPKRNCVLPNAGSLPVDTGPVQKTSSKRPPSCDSINGGSGSSTDGCPIDQSRAVVVIRKTGEKMELIQKNIDLSADAPILETSSPRSARIIVEKGDNRSAVGVVGPGCVDGLDPRESHKKNATLKKDFTCDRGGFDEFGLPSLLKSEPSLAGLTVDTVKQYSPDDVTQLCNKLGFEDGAKAISREEIDGTALLLLTRVDVMKSLGLKLGPALKLYRFVRTLQYRVKHSQ